MRTLKKITPLSGGFLKKYELLYDADGQDVRWEMISLNDLRGPQDLASAHTAVEVIARFEDGDYLLCREFRFPINDTCYEFPTGMIEAGETVEMAAIREIKEETGLDVVRVDRVLPAGCYSVGLTDELVVPVMVTVRGEMRPCHDPYEEITSCKMSLEEIGRLLKQPDLRMTETCLMALSMLVLSGEKAGL